MLTIDNFYENFVQGVLSSAESKGILVPEAFLEDISTYLIDDAELSDNFQLADYIVKGKAIEVHGYDFDEERGVLTLVIHEYYQSDSIQTMPVDDVKTKIKRVKNFFEKAIGGLYQDIEESTTAYEMAYDIYLKKDKISTVKFVVITNGSVSTRKNIDLLSEHKNDYRYEYKVFDINSIFKIYQENTDQDFNIDIKEIYGKALPCLKAPTQSDDYDSYLLVVPGSLLYEIYDMYGQKLLEENVRTFLQFRGKVNNGIRMTIKDKPEMFFALNNGLTTVANHIEFEDDNESQIKSIDGLQIVNGGQTTSAIYASAKNYKLDISNIYVQMKLSIIKNPEKHHKVITDISECANTQNKVNKADFFSNKPFYQDFKELSQRIFAPIKDGCLRKTRWFYERTRGQYLNEQAYLTDAQKKQFQMDYPSDQKIEKTLLSKSENAWLQLPWIVCKGGQYSFAKFAENVTEKLDKDEKAITEKYFKDAISKLILFKTTEKVIQKSSWYAGYKSNTVAYTLSLISYYFSKNDRIFNFEPIWEKQEVQKDLLKSIEIVTELVYNTITNPPAGFANVNEWTKREACWDEVKKIDISSCMLDILDKYSIDKEENYYKKKESKQIKNIDNSIQMQTFVLQVPKNTWKKIYDYYVQYKDSISPTEFGVLSSMVLGSIKVPSVSQAKVLYKIYKQIEKLGMEL